MVGPQDTFMAVYHELVISSFCDLEATLLPTDSGHGARHELREETHPIESYAEGEMYLSQELGTSQAGERTRSGQCLD